MASIGMWFRRAMAYATPIGSMWHRQRTLNWTWLEQRPSGVAKAPRSDTPQEKAAGVIAATAR